jgi:Protein of unknown function (DUF3106)
MKHRNWNHWRRFALGRARLSQRAVPGFSKLLGTGKVSNAAGAQPLGCSCLRWASGARTFRRDTWFERFCSLKAALPGCSSLILRSCSLQLQRLAVLCAILAVSGSLEAADQTDASTPTTLTNVSQSSASPPLPLGKSPVDVFRDLLAQTPNERAEFLAKRTPESQKLILAKLHEYESLSPEERTLRLEVTELRWYLLPLMKIPTAERGQRLAMIPAGPRKLVEPRLERWDKLPPDAQKQVLENEDILRYYLECAARNHAGFAPAAPADDRAINYNLEQFFNFTLKERRDILHTLSESERRQIENSLETFNKLAPALRSQCIRSFGRFASMSAQEKQQFLKNAQQWEAMSPSERQSWKDLVYKLSRLPPIPPGLGFPPLPPTLVPSAAGLPGNSRPLATNGHN